MLVSSSMLLLPTPSLLSLTSASIGALEVRRLMDISDANEPSMAPFDVRIRVRRAVNDWIQLLSGRVVAMP